MSGKKKENMKCLIIARLRTINIGERKGELRDGDLSKVINIVRAFSLYPKDRK